jgi:hypothetical protein
VRIKNHIVHNQISIANEFYDYFLNIAGNISNKLRNAKKEDVSPLQSLFKYFNQPIKDISWPYTSTKEINKIIDSLKSKNSSGYDEISTKVINISKPFIISPLINICNEMLPRISKLDRKVNEYIREKMDAPDAILDEITRKQLIWYGDVKRMDPT